MKSRLSDYKAKFKKKARATGGPLSFRWRAYLLMGLLACGAGGLIWRAVSLQLVDHTFLAKEGDARVSRVATIAAHRGTITDRYEIGRAHV